jgi:DNA-directed RNA polymerase subunit RPC12/RpoP
MKEVHKMLCWDCGHRWKGNANTEVQCPHCGSRQVSEGGPKAWIKSLVLMLALVIVGLLMAQCPGSPDRAADQKSPASPSHP